MNIKIGEYNVLKVIKEKPMGVFLDDGDIGILLPKRYVPKDTEIGDELNVFLYHDNEARIIATTEKPFGVLGDIVKLKAVTTTDYGAFLDWGIMKDLFIPTSQMQQIIHPGSEYLVKIVIDKLTGRLAATERLEQFLSNEELTVKEKESVSLLIYRRTNIGFEVIINNVHKGVLHFNEIYQTLEIGDKVDGFIKSVLPENKIDVVIGKMGYERVESETEKILRLLKENQGFLPYQDKSSPEEIYSFFGISKKTFKMAIGSLYKERKIEFVNQGIQLL
ncbi:MAG TPA: S1-like domain-containing RNA-binding protein [Arachidicoccus sp.]|nr:S1-like domain-containing RNA-binding protein [Arachidicoccus sp.]